MSMHPLTLSLVAESTFTVINGSKEQPNELVGPKCESQS